MNYEEIKKLKLQKLMENHKAHDFPEFLALIRHIWGFTRKSVCVEVGISETRMLFLEQGRFKKLVPTHELKIISDYYGIDYDILLEKAKLFYDAGHGKPQWMSENMSRAMEIYSQNLNRKSS